MSKSFAITTFIIQLIILICFFCFFDYKDATTTEEDTNHVTRFYAMFQDVHTMIFLGFGFLMTFLNKYGFSSVGLNFLISALCIQWAIIVVNGVHQFFDNSFHTVYLDITSLVIGDFAAGAVLISFGAVLGRITPLQLIWMALFEIIFYSINEYIGVVKMQAVDMGGSIFVHTFGAFFGLGVSWMLGVPTKEQQKENKSNYNSDLFAMIGTIFLWMFWPSFNGVLAPTDNFSQERVVINTVLALCASCVMAFSTSNFLTKKFDMVHIQNATLAGGVAVGSSSDLVIGPYGAIIIGLIAGFISVIGYVYISDFLQKKLNLYDTCGVNNLHGLPGIMGGLGGVISAMSTSEHKYGGNITDIFAARDTRTAYEQGLYQGLALLITLGISICSGLLIGKLLNSKLFHQQKNRFNDEEYWELPEEELEEEMV